MLYKSGCRRFVANSSGVIILDNIEKVPLETLCDHKYHGIKMTSLHCFKKNLSVMSNLDVTTITLLQHEVRNGMKKRENGMNHHIFIFFLMNLHKRWKNMTVHVDSWVTRSYT